MSKNIKLGNDTLTGVDTLRVEDADTAGTYDVFVDTSDANAAASDIASGKTAYVNGSKVTGTGGGGQQPTLFAPTVTGGVNEISWANNTQNGGFDVTLTADVDGTTVTSPLTITQEMDGKTLTITASATNFESASNVITLSYVNPTVTLVSPAGYVVDQENPYTYLRISNINTGYVSYNGQNYVTSPGNSNRFWIPVDLTRNNSIDLYVSGQTNSSQPIISFRKSPYSSLNVRYLDSDSAYGTAIQMSNVSMSVMDSNNNTLDTNTSTNTDIIISQYAIANIYTYHFIVNVTF